MINSMGGEQDNVVFLGRRSFRMEVVGQPDDEEMAIPASVSAVATQKLFVSDDAHAFRDAPSRAPAARRTSRATLIAMCSATFIFGVAVTLTFGHRAERRATEPAVVVAAPVVAPAPAPIVQPPPLAAPVVEPLRAAAIPVPLASVTVKPARASRPQPAHLAPTRHATAPAPAEAAPKPWADPFAE